MSQAADSISLFAPDTLIDPYEAYAHLREHEPVHHVPEMNLYVISRYDLLRQAIKDTATFSSKFDAFMANVQQAAYQAAPEAIRTKLDAVMADFVFTPPTMLTLDEPEHTQYRSLVAKLFTASVVKRAEAQVQAVIDDNLATLLAKTSSDFVEDFAFPVPLRIIGDRLGIPEEDRGFFDEAATAAAAGLRMSVLTPEETLRRAELARDLQQLLIRLIEARREEPRDDMITLLATSRLEEADRLLNHGEALSILNQFLVAGHETTTSTFGWGMFLLSQRPELQQRLFESPELVKTFVEEALRLESPVQGLPRVVTRDTELGGYAIPEGSMVMLRFGAANRDEAQFPNADTLDVQREKAGMQLAFGSGVHHCIGAPLARQELNLGFAALVQRLADIEIDGSTDAVRAEPSFILRNLPSLNIRYRVR